VSGGQTGVDRAALDFAIRRGIPHGGYCPKGRRSESGRIAAKYQLTECASADYAMRTALNVAHSDGTLILTRGRPEGGTQRTVFLCREYGKPALVIDLDRKLKSADFSRHCSPQQTLQPWIEPPGRSARLRRRYCRRRRRDARRRFDTRSARGRESVLPPPLCVGLIFMRRC
jgi:hypothetical protein